METRKLLTFEDNWEKKIEIIQKRERKKQTLERRMVIVDQGDKLVMKVKENDI